jgi:outer membrane protein TolC
LNEAIAMARVQSVDAAVALNELKTAYWEYRTFRADLLPEVNLTGTLPNYNKSYGSYQNADGSYSFVRNSALGLSPLQPDVGHEQKKPHSIMRLVEISSS